MCNEQFDAGLVVNQSNKFAFQPHKKAPLSTHNLAGAGKRHGEKWEEENDRERGLWSESFPRQYEQIKYSQPNRFSLKIDWADQIEMNGSCHWYQTKNKKITNWSRFPLLFIQLLFSISRRAITTKSTLFHCLSFRILASASQKNNFRWPQQQAHQQ